MPVKPSDVYGDCEKLVQAYVHRYNLRIVGFRPPVGREYYISNGIGRPFWDDTSPLQADINPPYSSNKQRIIVEYRKGAHA